jgi:uncharacterized membrane protein
MGKIYAEQTALKLIFETGVDLTDAEITLNALSPARAEKTFDLVIESPATAGIVSYEVEDDTDFDEVGTWTFWVSVVYESLKTTCSEAVKIKFYGVGE